MSRHRRNAALVIGCASPLTAGRLRFPSVTQSINAETGFAPAWRPACARFDHGTTSPLQTSSQDLAVNNATGEIDHAGQRWAATGRQPEQEQKRPVLALVA